MVVVHPDASEVLSLLEAGHRHPEYDSLVRLIKVLQNLCLRTCAGIMNNNSQAPKNQVVFGSEVRSSGFLLFFLSRRKEDVIKNQPVTR